MQKKKIHFKKWVLYTAFIVAFIVFLFISEKMQLIRVYNKEVDATGVIIIITAWEVLKHTIKAVIKRENKDLKNEV